MDIKVIPYKIRMKDRKWHVFVRVEVVKPIEIVPLSFFEHKVDADEYIEQLKELYKDATPLDISTFLRQTDE